MARILDSVESFLSPFSTFYGFQSLIQKCMASKTKREEETLIGGCLQLVKSKLGEPSPSIRSVINCLSFVVFADLLGYKAPFAHIHAVKLAGSSSIVPKKLGYLFCSYLLEPSHELSLLMVNTILRDLSLQPSAGVSYDDCQDPIAVAAALAAACYLTPLDSISTILPHVMDKLNHPSPFVRGKAVSALQHLASQVTGSRFFHTPEQLSSFLHGQPSSLMCKLLTDPHPSVVVVGLEFVHFLASQLQHMELCGNIEDSGSTVKVREYVGNELPSTDEMGSLFHEVSVLQDLAPALVHIQKQILNGKIPKEYLFHTVPAPWMQISILKLLRFLKHEEILANEVHKLLIETFRAANRRALIGWAVIIEVVHTAIEINLPESSFTEIVGVLGKLVMDSGPGKDSIPKWLSSNLLHTSLSLLQCLGRRNIGAVANVITSHDLQDGLSGSVNHIDPSIRRLAVGLITSHGSISSSIKGMCWTAEKISLLLLEECLPKKLPVLGLNHPVEQWKKECLERIVQITSAAWEPTEEMSWQLAVLLRALPLAPDRQTAILVRDRIQRFLLPPGDWEDFGSDNVPRDKVLKLLEKHCHSRCASSYLLELYIWVLSHFYYLLPETCPVKALYLLIHLGQKVVFNNRKGNTSAIVDVLIAIVQGVTLIILKKLNFGNEGGKEWNDIVELTENFAKSVADLDGTPQLIDAYNELLRILPHAQNVAGVIKESSSYEDSPMDFTLSFLDSYICKRLEEGSIQSSMVLPCHPIPPDCHNAELAISVRRQLSLCLPLHCHPWKVERVSSETKDDLDFSASMSLTHLPSSCTPSSHGTSMPDEFLSLSLESQPNDVIKMDEETATWGAQGFSRIWTSTGRSINLEDSTTSRIPFARKTLNLDQRTHMSESRQQPDLMSLLLQTGNSGVVLDQKKDQAKSSDPLDILLNDGLNIGDL